MSRLTKVFLIYYNNGYSVYIPINYGAFFFFKKEMGIISFNSAPMVIKLNSKGYLSFLFLRSTHYFVFLPSGKEKIKRKNKVSRNTP